MKLCQAIIYFFTCGLLRVFLSYLGILRESWFSALLNKFYKFTSDYFKLRSIEGERGCTVFHILSLTLRCMGGGGLSNLHPPPAVAFASTQNIFRLPIPENYWPFKTFCCLFDYFYRITSAKFVLTLLLMFIFIISLIKGRGEVNQPTFFMWK